MNEKTIEELLKQGDLNYLIGRAKPLSSNTGESSFNYLPEPSLTLEEAVADILDDYYSVKIPRAELERMLKDNPQVEASVKQWSAYDTLTRSEIMKMVTRELSLEDWPIYGDSEEKQNAFHKALAAACASRGWTSN
jgi:hypothetical protein